MVKRCSPRKSGEEEKKSLAPLLFYEKEKGTKMREEEETVVKELRAEASMRQSAEARSDSAKENETFDHVLRV